MIVFTAAMLLAPAQPGVAMPGRDPDKWIELLEPARPHDGVMTRSASCGRNRFSITITAAEPTGTEKIASLTLNGSELDAAEKAKVIAPFLPQTFIIDAYFAECSRTTSPSARLQLRVIHRPWRGNKEQFLDFWVGPDGKVSGVKFN